MLGHVTGGTFFNKEANHYGLDVQYVHVHVATVHVCLTVSINDLK